jgi:hypothetical protein
MISRVIVFLWTCFCIWGFVQGQIELQRATDLGPLGDAIRDVAAGFGFFAWLVFWGLVVVPVALIGLLFRPSERTPQVVAMNVPDPDRREPLLVTSGHSRVPCPYCAEPIMAAAVKCPHCRTELRPVLHLTHEAGQ